MKWRIKLTASVLLLTVAVLSGGITNRNQALAGPYSCRSGATCPNASTCDGDSWESAGNCSITCYKASGAPGQIVYSGSANCSPTRPGSGGGGGGSGTIVGYNWTEGEYCAENWWWDPNCSDANDPYVP